MTRAQRASAVQAAARTLRARRAAVLEADAALGVELRQSVADGLTVRQLAILTGLSVASVRRRLAEPPAKPLEAMTMRELVDYVRQQELPVTYPSQRRRADLLELIRSAEAAPC
jgi:hypothetical protein